MLKKISLLFYIATFLANCQEQKDVRMKELLSRNDAFYNFCIKEINNNPPIDLKKPDLLYSSCLELTLAYQNLEAAIKDKNNYGFHEGYNLKNVLCDLLEYRVNSVKNLKKRSWFNGR